MQNIKDLLGKIVFFFSSLDSHTDVYVPPFER